MKTTLTAILLASTTFAGAAFAQSNAAESDVVPQPEMKQSTDMSGDASVSQDTAKQDMAKQDMAKQDTAQESTGVDMEAHDAAVAAITSGKGDVTTSDDVVVGKAQRVQTDNNGNIIALIRLSDAMDTEITAIQAPLLVETEGDTTVLRIAISQADLQTALDAQQG